MSNTDEIGGTAHLGTKDEAERQLYEAFDQHLNKKPLQAGERRVTRFAQWTKTGIGRDMFDKVVAATKAAPPGASGGTAADVERAANIKKGASILIEETADLVIADAAKHAVKGTGQDHGSEGRSLAGGGRKLGLDGLTASE